MHRSERKRHFHEAMLRKRRVTEELSSFEQILVSVRSKVLICGRWLAGIAGANPSVDMDVCLLQLLCVVR